MERSHGIVAESAIRMALRAAGPKGLAKDDLVRETEFGEADPSRFRSAIAAMVEDGEIEETDKGWRLVSEEPPTEVLDEEREYARPKSLFSAEVSIKVLFAAETEEEGDELVEDFARFVAEETMKLPNRIILSVQGRTDATFRPGR